MSTVIFDLDGTLADIEHRKKFITGELGYVSWKNFNKPENVAKDKPKPEVIKVFQMYKNAGYKVLIFTGRVDISREITENWLEENNCVPDKLIMRPNGNHRPDTEMKTKWLNEEFPNDTWKTEVEAAYEDRDKVVKMYRDMGIQCFQVEYGDF